jgi:uncharacterized protein
VVDADQPAGVAEERSVAAVQATVAEEQSVADVQATAADGETHRLDPRWIPYRRRVAGVRSAVWALLLLAGAAAAVMLADVSAAWAWPPAVVLAIAITWLNLWWPGVAYRHASYRLTTRALEIRRGVLWRSVIDVPRSRIQHSDVSQGPFERLHGIGTLAVYTAGTHHALVSLHGLDHQRALHTRAPAAVRRRRCHLSGGCIRSAFCSRADACSKGCCCR